MRLTHRPEWHFGPVTSHNYALRILSDQPIASNPFPPRPPGFGPAGISSLVASIPLDLFGPQSDQWGAMKNTTTTKTPRTQRTEQQIVAAIEKLARELQDRNTRSRFLMAVQETKDRWNGKSDNF